MGSQVLTLWGLGRQEGEVREWGNQFTFLNSVHINIFMKTREEGRLGGEEMGEEGSVGPFQFYLTKKYERNYFHGRRR